jgi:hypothetical protein
MPYKDKAKNDACKRAYEEKHREEINHKRRLKRKTPEERAIQRRMYNSKPEHRRKRRACTVKYELGISLEEYEARREAQRMSGDLCGLCKQPLNSADSTPNLDHDHDTMQIREFLHRSCNMALGLLKDSSEMCKLASAYLERYGK